METNHAKEQARAQLASIHEMVERLEHATDCNRSDCTETRGEIEDTTEYHDRTKALEAITDDALDLSTRSGWGSPNDWVPEHYTILLSTGGPAVRIKGTLDQCVPETAQLEYQDWGTPWTRLTGLTDEDINALLTYAGCFYFGD